MQVKSHMYVPQPFTKTLPGCGCVRPTDSFNELPGTAHRTCAPLLLLLLPRLHSPIQHGIPGHAHVVKPKLAVVHAVQAHLHANSTCMQTDAGVSHRYTKPVRNPQQVSILHTSPCNTPCSAACLSCDARWQLCSACYALHTNLLSKAVQASVFANT